MKTIGIISIVLFGSAVIFEACNFYAQAKAQSGPAIQQQSAYSPYGGLSSIDVSKTSGYKLDSGTADNSEYRVLDNKLAKAILKRADIASLISSKNSRDDNGYVTIYNGFMGNDYYRVEFYVNNVTYDNDNPFLLHIDGKTRYKKNVTPFTGIITIDSVLYYSNLYDDEGNRQEGLPDVLTNVDDSLNNIGFHTKGTFRIAEDSTYKGSGTYGGKFYLDFSKNDYDNKEAFYRNSGRTHETLNGGLLLNGIFTYYSDNTTKPVLASPDFFSVGNYVLNNFTYGEREVEINPQYRALGWDDYWQNPEWYNESVATTVVKKMLQ